MNRKRTLGLALCASTSFFISVATPAAADVAADVTKIMEQRRNRESADLSWFRKAPPREVLTELWKYLGDPSERVRVTVLQASLGIASRGDEDRTLQREAVELVLTGIEQEPLPALANNIASRMVVLPRSAFSNKSKTIIERMMNNRSLAPHVQQHIIRLAGRANVQAIRVKRKLLELAEMSSSAVAANQAGNSQAGNNRQAESLKRPHKRAARWALANMGDKAAVQSFVAELNAATTLSERQAAVGNLAYLRQPESVAALVRLLFNDEPGKTEDDMLVMPVAADAVYFLAQIVEGFPVGSDELVSYQSQEKIARAREWVKQRGVANLRIKD